MQCFRVGYRGPCLLSLVCSSYTHKICFLMQSTQTKKICPTVSKMYNVFCSSVLQQNYQTDRKPFRQKNRAVLCFLVPCFTNLSTNLFACLPVRMYVQPHSTGGKIARASTSWRESRMEYYPLHNYYPLHTPEYATAFLASDWLYFLQHQINIFIQKILRTTHYMQLL